jgi:hypothetical protein
MLPKLGAHDSARPPKLARGVHSMNFEFELSEWFAILAAPTQRTEAVAAGSKLPPVRIPFLIF